MTVGAGTGWGCPGTLPTDAAIAADDHQLRSIVESARRAGAPIPMIGLTGGSIWTTIGGPSVVGRLHTNASLRYSVDVVRAHIDDGGTHWFVSALIARNTLWTRTTVAMNGQFWGPYRFGVRAHPGDGLIDVYESRLSLGDVAKVARRAKLGAHLPHPGIRELRTAETRLSFERPRRVWLDGESVGRARRIELTVEADALTVVI